MRRPTRGTDGNDTTMPKFDHEIEIEVPMEYVFEWSQEPANWQRTQPALVDYEALEERDDGLRTAYTYKMLGRTVSSEGVTRIDEAERRISFTFDGEEMRGSGYYEFGETESGTRVHMVTDLESGDSAFERVLQPVVNRYLHRQFRSSLQTMKDLIEAEHATLAAQAA